MVEFKKMLWALILQILAAILGLFLSQKYVTAVDFTGPLFSIPTQISQIRYFTKTLVFVGIVLGILNHFIKPVLNTITLPLRFVTFNLFAIVVSMFMVWLVDIFSLELIIQGLKALFFTTLIIWVIHLILSSWLPSSSKKN